MISSWSVASLLFQAIIFVFTCLSFSVALKQARVHLRWLIPLVAGQALGVISDLSNLFLISYMRNQHMPFSQVSWFLVPQQIVYGFRTLTALWFAVALFLTLRSQVFAPRHLTPPSTPGSWPPPPSV